MQTKLHCLKPIIFYERMELRFSLFSTSISVAHTNTFLVFVFVSLNPYFKGMVNQIYSPELQMNKANTTDTEAPFLDLHLSIANGFVASKIYDKLDDFDFNI